MADPAIQIWVWVASFLGSLAQEGETLGFAHDLGWGGCFFYVGKAFVGGW